MGKRAVVVGAGIGGLCAGAAVASFFEEVIVLENDAAVRQTGPRPGTPQAKHTHALLAGGLKAMGELFGGLEAALEDAGAVPLRESLDIRRERPGYDPMPQVDLGMTVYSMSRPLLEGVVRGKAQALPNLELREDCKARRFTGNGTAVTGVVCEGNGRGADEIEADLFVDATGHGRLTSEYLHSLTGSAVKETAVGVDVGYATTIFEIPGGAPVEWKAAATYPNPPGNRRSSYIFPIEGKRWMVTNTGRYGDKPPSDEAGFYAHLQGMRTSTAYEALREAKRCAPIAQSVFKANRRRSFKEHVDSLGNLIPFGDTICQFNPVYGQGMSVAALEATLLKGVLAKGTDGQPMQAVTATFLDELEPLIDAPWNMAVIPDFVDPLTEGEPPADLKQNLKFGAAVLKLASEDIAIYKLLMEVQHLLKPRSSYREPHILARLQPILQAMA